jgi:phosphoglycerate dehydrogenase-like enzyme
MRIVLWIPVDIYKNAVLPEVQKVPGAEIIVVDDPARLPDALTGAEGLITSGASKYTAEVAQIIREHGGSLRWIQTVAAGHEGFRAHGVPDKVTVTSSGGHSAPVVAEHAMALLLALAHTVPEAVRAADKAIWDRAFRSRLHSLSGNTLMVVGLGKIGQQIARRARAFDMKVIAVTRSGSPSDHVDEVFPHGRLNETLPRADETARMMGAAQFEAMKSSAYLVNISRGGMVDQDALIGALASGAIAGAGLDVTDPEPLPDGHPLWSAPHLIITPHMGGGGSADSPKRLAAAVVGNLKSLMAGEPLQHILPFGAHRA